MAVVVDWGAAMQFDDEWVLRVQARIVDGRWMLALPEGAQPWGNQHHASPELCMEWKRANDELERAKAVVVRAYRAKTTAEEGVYLLLVARLRRLAHGCWLLCPLLCRRRRR